MKSFYTILLFVLFLTTSCGHHFFSYTPQASVSNILWVNRLVLHGEGFEVANREMIFPSTFRYLRNDVWTNRFSCKTVSDARGLFLRLFHEYTKPFNESKILRAHLHEWPVTDKMFEFDLYFYNEKNELLSPPYFARIRNGEGKILYFFWNAQKVTYELAHSEPFEEAERMFEHKEK
jgi:hypothetical protein